MRRVHNGAMRILLASALAVACSSDPVASSAVTDSGTSDGTTTDSTHDSGVIDLRGERYCEILLGTFSGELLKVAVYNTIGLSDCPTEAWSKQDVAALKAETKADIVVLNGPRFWTLNSFAGSKLLDETLRTLGGMPMRQAGAVELPVADLMELQKPYVLRTIQRDSVVTFYAGKTVFELTAADGRVYTMQSYSTQKSPQTEASLGDLASKLTLPAGWSFGVRTLTTDLVARAVERVVTVVQDELGNTYLRSK